MANTRSASKLSFCHFTAWSNTMTSLMPFARHSWITWMIEVMVDELKCSSFWNWSSTARFFSAASASTGAKKGWRIWEGLRALLFPRQMSRMTA